MKDLIKIAVECMLESSNEEEAKIKFCDEWLNELTNMKGEDLAPHLETAVFDKNKKKVIITLAF